MKRPSIRKAYIQESTESADERDGKPYEPKLELV